MRRRPRPPGGAPAGRWSAGTLVALGILVAAGCSGPRVTPAAGCAQPLLSITNRGRTTLAAAYQLSGTPGQRFLVVYYTVQDERARVIDSLPPIGPPPRFLGLVSPGRTEQLGPVEGLTMGEGPRVRISVRTYFHGQLAATSVRSTDLPYLVCPRGRGSAAAADPGSDLRYDSVAGTQRRTS